MSTTQHAWAALEAMGTWLQSVLGSRAKADRLEVTHILERAFKSMVSQLAPKYVLEIGAHGAEFSRSVKERLPAARVVAFEANPDVFARHQGACKKAGIEYIQQCVADTPKSVRLRVPVSRIDGEQRWRTGSILVDLSKATSKFDFIEHEVSATSVDAYLGIEAGIASIALWIDVEGAVGAVLAGATRALDGCVAVYVEIGKQEHWRGQMLDRQVVERLGEHGLVPCLRDAPRDSPLAQYNALFLHLEAVSDGAVASLVDQCRRDITAYLGASSSAELNPLRF